MGVNARSSIMSDIPNEIQTGEKLQILAIPHTEIAEVVLTYAFGVPPMGNVFMWYYPPENTVAHLHQLYMQCQSPGFASSGTHYFEAYIGANRIVTKGQSVYNSSLEFNYNHWYIANSLSLPPGAEAQGIAIASMYATQITPITFVYQNNTNQTQSGTLTIKLTAELWSRWA